MSMELGVASPERQQWWNCGFVAPCTDVVNVVLVGLDKKAANNSDTDPGIRTANVTVTPSSDFRGQFYRGMGFAVVESKLYAFGGREVCDSPEPDPEYDFDLQTGKSYWTYPRYLYVCDLGTDPEIQKEPLQFRKMEVKLNGPKVCPIHVSYKKEKLFILSKGYPPISPFEPERPAPCEVLNLKDLTVQTIDTPSQVWDTDVSSYKYNCFLPVYLGHVVVGSELIVYIDTDTYPCLYALDMESLKWRPIITSTSMAQYAVNLSRKDLLLGFMAYTHKIYDITPCSNVVRNGKVFQLRIENPDTVHKPHVRPNYKDVTVVNLDPSASYDQLLCLPRKPEARRLFALAEFLQTTPGDNWETTDAGVLPFGYGDDDVYCLFLWHKAYTESEASQEVNNSFSICRFKLVGNYGRCKVLETARDFGRFMDDLECPYFTAFTPTSDIGLCIL
ncbi:unnamed protein product [Linum tenue]|uniref:Uncharacterized protein n=1 Tax=Linum tenue TaxID=586396 RepID=A0AAV0R0V8_9ROSI|nr:unnamed protein product [Linum tenue]